MTAAWILVMLLVAFVVTRIFRSTKMWWALMSAILAGLLVGMLSKEVVKTSNSNITSSAQLINTVDDLSVDCMQFVAAVTESPTIGHSEIVSNNPRSILSSFDALVSSHTTRGRDSPYIEDDS